MIRFLICVFRKGGHAWHYTEKHPGKLICTRCKVRKTPWLWLT